MALLMNKLLTKIVPNLVDLDMYLVSSNINSPFY